MHVLPNKLLTTMDATYLDTQVLVLGAIDQITAHIFQGTYIPGGQSDTDAVNRGGISTLGLLNIFASSSLQNRK